jgi:hypothetical protein
MKKPLAVMLTLTFALAGCATTHDPTLVSGVKREGSGVYSSSEMSSNDPTKAAIQQCQLDGNKRLSILTSTTERGIVSGTNYAKLVFRCE